MNKKQLVNKIASQLNQSKADAERTFDTITDILLGCLKSDEAVKIAGLFSSCSVQHPASREYFATLSVDLYYNCWQR